MTDIKIEKKILKAEQSHFLARIYCSLLLLYSVKVVAVVSLLVVLYLLVSGG